jgi:hypothetical protein
MMHQSRSEFRSKSEPQAQTMSSSSPVPAEGYHPFNAQDTYFFPDSDIVCANANPICMFIVISVPQLFWLSNYSNQRHCRCHSW